MSLQCDTSTRFKAGLSAFLASVAVALFAHRAWLGLWLLPFSDELTHLLGGKVINSGGVLYRDFVDNHGPVIYMLSACYGALVGWDDPNYARLISVILVVGAGGSVAASPALTGPFERCSAAAMFFGLAASVWVVQGFHYVSFYPVAGALTVVVVSMFWLPTCLGGQVSAPEAFFSGVAAALLGFTAYSYMPAAALIAIGGLWTGMLRANLRPPILLILGGFCGSAFVFAWLARFGDIVGYLAFHIAFNQTAFLPFASFGLRHFLGSMKPAFEPRFLVQAWTLIAFAVGGVLTLQCARARKTQTVWMEYPIIALGLAAIMSLDARGAWSFVNGPFVLGTIALLSIVLPRTLSIASPSHPIIRGSLPVLLPLIVAITEVLFHHATTTPYALDLAAREAVPVTLIDHRSGDPLAEHIRSIILPSESFLALVYEPALYFAADRLPMPGFFAYFPWDAAYARSPWFNRPRDLCDALKERPPKVIAFDIQAAQASFGDLSYMPCVFRALESQYRPEPGFPTLYVHLNQPSIREQPGEK